MSPARDDGGEGEGPAGEGAAPRPGAWDAPEGAAFAERLAARRDLPLHADGWGAFRLPSDGVDALAARRELAATLAGRVLPRWAAPARDAETIPAAVKAGLRRNQKPFHLWNVERVEEDAPFGLTPVDGLVVGRAATLPEELRPPRRLEKATRALVEWLEGEAFRRVLERRARAERRALWVEPLPFGRPDDEPEPGRTVVLDIAGPGGPGPLPPGFDPRRLRGPLPDLGGGGGGFSMAQPDDHDDDDGAPAGGFAMTQPDDDD